MLHQHIERSLLLPEVLDKNCFPKPNHASILETPFARLGTANKLLINVHFEADPWITLEDIDLLPFGRTVKIQTILG